MESNGPSPDMKPYVFFCYRTYELILIAAGVVGTILLGLLLLGGYVDAPWWSVLIPGCLAVPFGLPAWRRAWKGQWIARTNGEYEFVVEDDTYSGHQETHIKVRGNQQPALLHKPQLTVACGLQTLEVKDIIKPVNPEQLNESSQWKGVWEAYWPQYNELDLQRLRRNPRISLLAQPTSAHLGEAMNVRFQVFSDN